MTIGLLLKWYYVVFHIILRFNRLSGASCSASDFYLFLWLLLHIFFTRYRRFYFYLITSQHLCDFPNNDLGAFLPVEFFILALIDIISYLFIILCNKMMPSCHCSHPRYNMLGHFRNFNINTETNNIIREIRVYMYVQSQLVGPLLNILSRSWYFVNFFSHPRLIKTAVDPLK